MCCTPDKDKIVPVLYIWQGQDGLATGLSPPHSVSVLYTRQGQDGLATGLSSPHFVPVPYIRQRQDDLATELSSLHSVPVLYTDKDKMVYSVPVLYMSCTDHTRTTWFEPQDCHHPIMFVWCKVYIRQGQDGQVTGLSSPHSVPVLYTRQRQDRTCAVHQTRTRWSSDRTVATPFCTCAVHQTRTRWSSDRTVITIFHTSTLTPDKYNTA